MYVSLNWLRDFVDIPASLDPRQLALRFTVTAAEVEGVEHHAPNFKGLVAAKIESISALPGEEKLKSVAVSLGARQVSTVSTAPNIASGDLVIYAPPGATIAGHEIGTRDPQGRAAEGMIVAGQGVGLSQIGANAIHLPPKTPEGQAIDPAPFDDWIIEIDNKSITHRPDLWGHYGIAREFAAMLETPLRPYDVTDVAKLTRSDLPAVPIEIDDPEKCPRYSALVLRGLRPQPSPLWMQVRLAYVGMRPIDLIVDLTNYVMADLGQPMHAFDAAKLRTIHVGLAKPGEKFKTLDGVTRTLPNGTLMIQSDRRSVAIAGVMGGAETEVSATTDSILLESANFDAPTIRRAATAMGHRTEASARFEKSLDPANTVLGIARFHRLAVAELPDLQLAGALSDAYPRPLTPKPITLDCGFASRLIGKSVTADSATKILSAIEFRCEPSNGNLRVTPPSFRATKDISIEEDVIEELARFIGYDSIEPAMPRVTARHFERSHDLVIEERTLDYLCVGGDFAEVHDYIWYDDRWLQTLNYDPGACVMLRNPAAEGSARLRQTLVPGMLAFADRNRRHMARFQLAQIGSVFLPGRERVEESQHRNLALLVAQSGGGQDSAVWDRLRTAMEGWTRQVLEDAVCFVEAEAACPWEDADRLASIEIDGKTVGRATVIPLKCKQGIDERLKAWSMSVAEINLTALADCIARHHRLSSPPRHPVVELDFNFLADAARRYRTISERLRSFRHPLLRRLSFVDGYEGKSIPAGKRALTIRATLGRADATLSESDIGEFQSAFRAFLHGEALELRG